jgi:hypothetical protein
LNTYLLFDPPTPYSLLVAKEKYLHYSVSVLEALYNSAGSVLPTFQPPQQIQNNAVCGMTNSVYAVPPSAAMAMALDQFPGARMPIPMPPLPQQVQLSIQQEQLYQGAFSAQMPMPTPMLPVPQQIHHPNQQQQLYQGTDSAHMQQPMSMPVQSIPQQQQQPMPMPVQSVLQQQQQPMSTPVQSVPQQQQQRQEAPDRGTDFSSKPSFRLTDMSMRSTFSIDEELLESGRNSGYERGTIATNVQMEIDSSLYLSDLNPSSGARGNPSRDSGGDHTFSSS